MQESAFDIHEADSFRYVDEGPSSERPPIMLLHGMLGDLSNWTATIRALADHNYRVLVPLLPVYDMPLKETSVPGLVEYVRAFQKVVGVDAVVLAGNSLGGQVATMYALRYPQAVSALILSGASGIYEVEMGSSTPRRQDRNYIRERAAVTFYDPVHATDELVEEMYHVVNDRGRVMRLIRMARSTKKETVTDRLSEIDVPTLLVWGQNDRITPPDVARQFEELIPHADLRFIDRCGHAPMIEHPDAFNRLVLEFLQEHAFESSPALSDNAPAP